MDDAPRRQLVSSGGPWEDVIGYSRAVRVGNVIAVSGCTAALPDGSVHAPGDAYEQTKMALGVIEQALAAAGASMDQVIRTRMFVTDISRWEDVGRAHGECFRGIKPAATMVQVQALIHPDMVVEIEADAVVEQ